RPTILNSAWRNRTESDLILGIAYLYTSLDARLAFYSRNYDVRVSWGEPSTLPGLPVARSLGLLRMQDQLLHAPVRGFGGIDQIFGRAGQLVRTGELTQLAA